jgi:hypothetical protein
MEPQTRFTPDAQSTDDYLLWSCSELKRELCQVLGVLLPNLTAHQKAREAQNDAALAGQFAATYKKNVAEDIIKVEEPIGLPRRARGGLKKASDFAIDDLSLTLAVASLLKALYVVLDASRALPDRKETLEPTSAHKQGIADASRLVTAIVRRGNQKLDLNDFLSLVGTAEASLEILRGQLSGQISADASLAKAPMVPVNENIKRLDFSGMSEEQSNPWKDVDRGISLVLSIASKRLAPSRSIYASARR